MCHHTAVTVRADRMGAAAVPGGYFVRHLEPSESIESGPRNGPREP